MGNPTSGRGSADLFAYLLSMLALPTELAGNPKRGELTWRVRRAAQVAYEVDLLIDKRFRLSREREFIHHAARAAEAELDSARPARWRSLHA